MKKYRDYYRLFKDNTYYSNREMALILGISYSYACSLSSGRRDVSYSIVKRLYSYALSAQSIEFREESLFRYLVLEYENMFG